MHVSGIYQVAADVHTHRGNGFIRPCKLNHQPEVFIKSTVLVVFSVVALLFQLRKHLISVYYEYSVINKSSVTVKDWGEKTHQYHLLCWETNVLVKQ